MTVLMATYRGDDPGYLRKALDSVYANTLRPDEVRLVLDGPIPATTRQLIAEFEHREGLVVQQLPQNMGLALALNAGLSAIRTEWVVRADADDLNLPERFAFQARAIEAEPHIDVLGGAIVEIDKQGAVIGMRTVPTTHDEIRAYLRLRSPFNHMTVAYRLSPVLAVGGYPDIYLREDYGLWASLLAHGCVAANLPDVLVHATAGRDMYRRRGGWRYARGELSLQRHLVRLGIKSAFSGTAHGLLRAIVFLLPQTMRGAFYERLLRKSAFAHTRRT
ncbi:glycosyltransferase [Piscinibacter sp. HJYY11]|uniref:glycosyltransferase n=1 Tax=Piscinibacter sp. HJYY11 TaxID=2801333 RepID=UPI003857C1CE